MHCSGCKNLITMSLEDVGFTDIIVDQDKNNAKFTSLLNITEIESKLKVVFEELTDYKYSNLNIVT